MAMLSTLSVAVDVHRTIQARQAGLDPSNEEPDSLARAFLQHTLPDLHLRLTRLQTSLVAVALEEAEPLRTAHRFQQMMILRHLNRLLHMIHQRLLSLYPEVSDLLVEAARRLETHCSALLEAPPQDLDTRLNAFLDEGRGFTCHLETELRSP